MKHITLCLLALTLAGGGLAAADSPNILLILTDDHGWSQLSAQMDPAAPESKSDYLETPHINRLMAEGMRFVGGYSPAPLCTPTRRSILCGTSAARSGTEFRSPWVPAEHLTIPMALKRADAGYRCAHFGKWGEQMISTPEQCGYDASDGETGNVTGGMPSSLGVKGGHEDGPPHFIDNDDPKRTRTVTDRAIDFIRAQAGAGHPFYVQASYYAQHLSVVCSQQSLEKYEAKGTPDRGYSQAWAAMLEELDRGVGRLLDAIDELGMEKETYVFFTADNGGRGTVPGGSEERLAPNHPLTGAKHSLFEGGIRVPFLARGPGISAGSVSRIPVVGYDFLPTFFDLAGGKGDLGEEIDGASFVKALRDPSLTALDRPRQALFFHRPGRLESAIREGDYKLRVVWQADGTIAARELYRVGAHPVEEGHEISAQESEKALAMEKRLLDYLESVDAEKPRKENRNRRKAKG